MSVPFKYWAFISYSFKDRKVAEWLIKRLENYPIPRIFRDVVLSDGAKRGARLKPVFRDRDELTGAAELGPSLRQALEESRYIIVLCSRNSARSRWVNQEIEDFQVMGRGRCVLALIIDGEPNASGNPALPDEEECFPPALRYPNAEPIAGDLRKTADGPERGFLKVLAGVAELDFDVLYQRHAREKKKRRIISGCVTATVLVTLAGLTWFGLRQKQEAARQRQEAAKADLVTAEGEWEQGNQRASLAYLARAADSGVPYLPVGPAAIPKLLASLSPPAPLLVLDSHRGKIIDTDYSPDGRLLATASSDRTARLWDTMTGKQLQVLDQHGDGLLDVDFSADGTRLVTAANDGKARIWDVATGGLLHIMDVGTKPVSAAVFSPDGTKVFTASQDMIARLWDAVSGKIIRVLPHHANLISAVGFSPDGERMLTASFDKTVRVYDTVSGNQVAVITSHTDWIYDATFSPDGTTVLTASADKTAGLWDATTGAERFRFSQHGDGVEGIAFSPDGQRVITGSLDQIARVWDTTNGELVCKLSGHTGQISEVIFSPDGLLALTASHDGTARIWDASFGRETLRLDGHTDAVRALSVSPDGRRVSTGSWDGTVRVWETLEESAGGLPPDLSVSVNAALFTPDGRHIVSGYTDSVVLVHDVVSGEVVAGLDEIIAPDGNRSAVLRLSVSPDSDRVLVVSVGGVGRLWNISTDSVVTLPGFYPGRGGHAVFTPDGTRLAAGLQDGTLAILDTVSGTEVAGWNDQHGPLSSLAVSPDGSLAAAGFDSGAVELRELASGRLLNLLEVGATVRVAFSPDGRHLAVASEDSIIHIMEVISGKVVALPALHRSGIDSLAFSPDGQRLATGGGDGTTLLWDVKSGSRAATLPGHAAGVIITTFSPDGCHVLTGSADLFTGAADPACVRVWSATTGAELARIPWEKDWVQQASFSPDGKTVLALFRDRTLRTWRLPPLDGRPAPQWLGDLLTLRSGRKFDPRGALRDLSPEEVGQLNGRLAAVVPGGDAYSGIARWALRSAAARPSVPGDLESRTARAAAILSSSPALFVPDYRYAYRLDPKHPLIHLALANIEPNGATAAFLRRRSLDILPDDPILELRAAEMLQDQGEWALALDLTERVLARSPDDLASLERRAVLLIHLDKKEDALGAWRTVIARDPAHIEGLTSAALLAATQGGHDEAAVLLSRADTASPDNETVSRRRGWCLAEKSDWTGALASFTRALSLTDEPLLSLRCGISTARWHCGDQIAGVESFASLIRDEQDFAFASHILSFKWSPRQTAAVEAVRAATLMKYPELAPPAEERK